MMNYSVLDLNAFLEEESCRNKIFRNASASNFFLQSDKRWRYLVFIRKQNQSYF